MTAVTISNTIGSAMAGSFYAGCILVEGRTYALIVAPKAEGEHKPTLWIPKYKAVPGAQSYNDGLANTKAMAEAGSELAKWALDLRIADQDDWYLPSQDELEIIYRNLKPTTQENACWARSGINLSAAEPTRPYEPANPGQTQAGLFIEGGEQAFEAEAYWSSTQYASDSDFAWHQYFDNGIQARYSTNDELMARAVRRLAI